MASVRRCFLLGYVAIHLSNHLAGLWGAEAHLALMGLLRRWYRHPHDAIGVLALVLHVSAGSRVVMLAHGASPARVAWMQPAG